MANLNLGKPDYRAKVGVYAGEIFINREKPLILPALFADDDTAQYEFGQIVELVGDTKTNFTIKEIGADTVNTGTFGVIMGTITGATRTYNPNGIITAERHIVVNVFILDRLASGSIGVALKLLEGQTDPLRGGKVFVGNGTNGTISGAVYPEAVTDGTIELANVEVASEVFTPYLNGAKTIAIQVNK